VFENIQQLFANTISKVLTFCMLKRLSKSTPSVLFTNAVNDGYDMPVDPAEKAELIAKTAALTWEKANIKVYMPEMIGKEYGTLVTAVSTALTNGLISDKIAATLVMTALGVENATDLAAEMFGDLEDGEDADQGGEDIDPNQQKIDYILQEIQKRMTPKQPEGDNGQ
jgi:hypothetical protein